ncbi:MCE family protein [Actinomadura barringtoniae]|uniref:MCE family protein n=1 Tax=Actinomadura barringtoniae TaxID=1427535 RepID=A0A939P899_9ACTN|nr:MCE family protein [Actinomadura barringtoniae]MBO2447590.1 MCE family protein [Actinomadura barringtoniae]
MARGSERARSRAFLLARMSAYLLATGALTAFIAMQIARVGFTGGYHLTATFDDASGLHAGDRVKIAGAPVGQVSGVAVVDGRARVSLTVDEDVTIPSDSEAAIRWRDAMGHRVVYLIPGTSTEKMRPGTHISRTRSVVDASDLLDQLAPLTRSLNADDVNTLLGALAQALDGNSGNVSRLIANVDTLSSTIAVRRRTLSQMLSDYGAVTGVIAKRDKQIRQAIDNLVTLSDAYTRNSGLVDDTLVQVSRMSKTADDVFGKNADQVATTLDRLAVLTSGTRRNTDLLVKVLADAGPKLQHFFSTVDRGHFINLAAPCVNIAGPPCPYATKLPERTGSIASTRSLEDLLIGRRP